MRLELDAEQSLIVEQLRDFSRKELAPLAEKAEQAGVFAKEGVEALRGYGLLAMRAPEDLGGLELDPVTCCRVISELAWVDASLATIVALQNGWAIEHLRDAASPAQKQRILVALAEGALIACGGERLSREALTPAHAPQSQALKVRRDGDDWILEGQARFVTLGDEASLLLLTAAQEDDPHKVQSFVLEGELRKQVEVQPVETRLGLRGASVAHLRCSALRVPEDARLTGGTQAKDPWLSGRVVLAAVSVGLSQASSSHAQQYAQQRKQFGKPIAAFQAIQWKVADMAMKHDAAALMVDQAAALWMEQDWEALDMIGRQARLLSAETAVWAGQEAIQIHGGYGFIREFPVERFYRDAQTLRARWGGPSAQQHTIAQTWLQAQER